MTRRIFGWMLCAGLLLGAGGCRGGLSNTGYSGTWTRGNARNTSMVWIVPDGDSYRFRWSLGSSDGALHIDCDWNGYCEEFINQDKVAEHEYKTWVDADTGKLMLKCDSTWLAGEVREGYYVHELEVTPDGMGLWSYTVEQNGQHYEGSSRPKRLLKKVSDRVPDPPAES